MNVNRETSLLSVVNVQTPVQVICCQSGTCKIIVPETILTDQQMYDLIFTIKCVRNVTFKQ
jgi:hypothetical protein